MKYIILMFGAATAVAGLILVINPETIFGLLRRKMESIGMHILAVGIRIILGVALIMAAAESKISDSDLYSGMGFDCCCRDSGNDGPHQFQASHVLGYWPCTVLWSHGRVGGHFVRRISHTRPDMSEQ